MMISDCNDNDEDDDDNDEDDYDNNKDNYDIDKDDERKIIYYLHHHTTIEFRSSLLW